MQKCMSKLTPEVYYGVTVMVSDGLSWLTQECQENTTILSLLP